MTILGTCVQLLTMQTTQFGLAPSLTSMFPLYGSKSLLAWMENICYQMTDKFNRYSTSILGLAHIEFQIINIQYLHLLPSTSNPRLEQGRCHSQRTPLLPSPSSSVKYWWLYPPPHLFCFGALLSNTAGSTDTPPLTMGFGPGSQTLPLRLKHPPLPTWIYHHTKKLSMWMA